MSATPLLILGSGSFATEVLEIAEASGRFRPADFVNSLVRTEPAGNADTGSHAAAGG